MGVLFGRLRKSRSVYMLTILTLVLACILAFSSSSLAETPTLHLVGSDKAPRYIYTGPPHEDDMQDIVMLQIQIGCEDEGEVNITEIAFHRTGLGTDEYVDNLYLYEDSNLNGELDLATDELVSTTNFTMGKARFAVDITLDQTTDIVLLVALDISSSAESKATVGLNIPYDSYITTKEPAALDFEFPICSKNSTILLDTDGDLNPDDTDSDDDNDNYMDSMEISHGSDPKDSGSIPLDTDGDYIPDSVDTDDDNDGVPDEYDDFPLDPDRQRDYTIVIIYALIAAVLIIVLLFLRFKPKKPRLGRKKPIIDEDEDFDEALIDEDLEEEFE